MEDGKGKAWRMQSGTEYIRPAQELCRTSETFWANSISAEERHSGDESSRTSSRMGELQAEGTEEDEDEDQEIQNGRGEKAIRKRKVVDEKIQQLKNHQFQGIKPYANKQALITEIGPLITESCWIIDTADVNRLLLSHPKFLDFMHARDYNRTIEILLQQARISWQRNNFAAMARACFENKDSESFNDCASPEESIQIVYMLLHFNRIDFSVFREQLIDIVDMRLPKKNAMFFEGEPDAGKTLFFMSVVRACRYYAILSEFSRTSNAFFLEPAIDQRALLFNEPVCDDTKIEQFKNVCEGVRLQVNIKGKHHQSLQRTPTFITANRKLAWATSNASSNEAALKSRMFIYRMNRCDMLRDFKSQLHPGLWHLFLNENKF